MEMGAKAASQDCMDQARSEKLFPFTKNSESVVGILRRKRNNAKPGAFSPV